MRLILAVPLHGWRSLPKAVIHGLLLPLSVRSLSAMTACFSDAVNHSVMVVRIRPLTEVT